MSQNQSSQQLCKVTPTTVNDVLKQLARYFSHNDVIISSNRKKGQHVGCVFTEYLPWIDVTGPALPSTTFALSLRLPLTD